MAGHEELFITFTSGSNVDAVAITDTALKWFGWDEQENRAVFARRLIRGWAEKARDDILRPQTTQQAKDDVAAQVRDID